MLIEQLELYKITEPALIMQTKKDRIVDPESANFIYNQISSENKELIWLEESSHTKPHEKEEQEILEAVAQFIKANSN